MKPFLSFGNSILKNTFSIIHAVGRLQKETESRVRLESRGYLGCALYCRVGSTHIFINAPFDKMSYEQMQLSNLLMECLEDAIYGNASVIEKHKFFQIYDEFQVLFFPLVAYFG